MSTQTGEKKKMKWDPVYDLNRDMLKMLGEEFPAAKPVEEFAKKIKGVSKDQVDKIAKEIFGEFGTNWMKRVLELGDDPKYMDRGYVILKNFCARPTVGLFPFSLQRTVEVAYLGLNQKLAEMGIFEVNTANLEFWVDDVDCEVYQAEKEKLSPEVLETLPCKHLCLCGLQTLMDERGIKDAKLIMLDDMPSGAMCRFSMKRAHIKLPTEPRLDAEGRDMAVFRDLPRGPKAGAEEHYVVDARELIPKKVEYEVGGHYDKLKPGQTLKVIAHGDLRWLEKRLKMHRPGMFKVELSRDEKENAYIAMVERLYT